MATQHASITDPNIHEPKGVVSASNGDMYFANGAGSGDWKSGAGGAYADMDITAGVTTFPLAAASAYTKLNPTGEWQSGLFKGLVITPANGEITLTKAGVYLVNFWVTFDTASLAAGTNYSFKYAVDGVVANRVLSVQKNTAGVDRIGAAAQGIVSADAGQLLSVHAAGDVTSSGTNITVTDSGLTVVLLIEN